MSAAIRNIFTLTVRDRLLDAAKDFHILYFRIHKSISVAFQLILSSFSVDHDDLSLRLLVLIDTNYISHIILWLEYYFFKHTKHTWIYATTQWRMEIIWFRHVAIEYK